MPFWNLVKKHKTETASASLTLLTPLPATIFRTKPMLPTVPNLTPLQLQYPSRAQPATKIRHSILAIAMVDALGGPAEFHQRFGFDPIINMIPNDNFDLPAGVWTDDTSMTLCLARSLTRSPGVEDGFDERGQLQAYSTWFHQGELSAVGRCFDIGGTTRRALHIFQMHRSRPIEEVLAIIQADMGRNVFSGNGSLMRVLPIGLAYWRDEDQARTYAARSSRVTHPSSICVEACEVWTGAIVKVMQTASGKGRLSKLDLLEHFALYSYSNDRLRVALTVPASSTPLPSDASLAEREGYYWLRHPLLRKVAAANEPETCTKVPGLPYPLPSDVDVSSSGFVLHSLVAALYCFMSTQTFEEGALMAINMGDDADTVGAIYAGLAGVWYAEEDITDRFWSERVLEWKRTLVRRDIVEQVADELAIFSEISMGWA